VAYLALGRKIRLRRLVPRLRALLPTATIAWTVIGCTNLLGIEGDYVLGSGGSTSTSSGGHTEGSSGGAASTTGGSTASGGTLPVASGGGVADSGHETSEDSGAGCQPGHYTGTFDGVHSALVTVVGVPATVKTSTLSFDLTGGGRTLTVQAGTFQADLTSVVPDAGKLNATLSGQYDCARRQISGQISGQFNVVNFVPAAFSGTWRGALGADGTFTGTWTERETARPASLPDAGAGGSSGAACVPGVSLLEVPIGTGCGTWTAK
jgi:hypothetical protein